MVYNKKTPLFILTLIFIYIVINTNILQLLLTQAHILRNVTTTLFAVKKDKQDVADANMLLRYHDSPEQNSCSDFIGRVNIDNNKPIFSNKSVMTDRQFFYEKRTIIAIFCNFFISRDSILIWSDAFRVLRSQIREKLIGVLSWNFDATISDLSSRLLIGESMQGQSRVGHLIKVTGTQHLFAISGFNLTFVISFFSVCYKWFLHKRYTAVLNFVIVLSYFCLITLSFSLVRALCMSFFAILSKQLLYRQYSPLLALFYTVILIFLFDKSIFYSISFQLSFAATLGILLYAAIPNSKNSLVLLFLGDLPVEIRERLLGNNSVAQYFIDSLKVSIVAQLSVLPLLLYHFDELSILTLPVTILAGWIFPLVLSIGFTSSILSMLFFFSSDLSFIVSLPFYFILNILLMILGFLSFDQAIIEYTKIAVSTVFLQYGVLLLLYLIYFTRKIKKKEKENDQIARILL